MVAAATARGSGCGNANCRSWPTSSASDIVVSHLPSGTSKWNKIEHRLFSFISQNWRAQPLISYRVIVELIRPRPPKPASPCAVNSTPAYTPAALSCPTPRSPPSTSNGPSSTASGTTPSHQIPIRQIARLFPDAPLGITAPKLTIGLGTKIDIMPRVARKASRAEGGVLVRLSEEALSHPFGAEPAHANAFPAELCVAFPAG